MVQSSPVIFVVFFYGRAEDEGLVNFLSHFVQRSTPNSSVYMPFAINYGGWRNNIQVDPAV